MYGADKVRPRGDEEGHRVEGEEDVAAQGEVQRAEVREDQAAQGTFSNK